MNKLTENDIQKSLLENSQNPDLSWVKKTRENLSVFAHNSVTDQKQSRISVYTLFNFLSFSSMQSTYRKPLALGLAATALAVGGLIGAYVYVNNRNTSQSTKVYLSEAEQSEFLANVIKNNPKQTLAKANFESQVQNTSEDSSRQANNAGTQSNKMMAESAPSTSDMSILPYPYSPEYKYRYSKTDITFGDANKTCKALNSVDAYNGQGLVSESFEYYDQNGTSRSKWITKTANGQIINYNLSTYETSRSEYYTYLGGSFAVKTTTIFSPVVYEGTPTTGEVTIMPVEDMPKQEPVVEPSPTDLISQYFGPDAKVVEKVTRDGKDLYIVEYSYKINCDEDMARIYMSSYPYPGDQTFTDTVIMRDLIEIENFQVHENFSYLNTVSEENLISRTKSSTIANNDSFESVAKNFVFDINVPVKEELFDWSTDQPLYDYKKEANALADYLVANPIDLLYVNGANLSGIYSMKAFEQINKENQKETINYYADRSFYPVGEVGDEMFKTYNSVAPMVEEYVTEVASINFSGESYFSISMFNKSDTSVEKIRKQFNGYSDSDPNATKTSEQVTVQINNQPVSAVLDSITYTYSNIDPAVTFEGDANDAMLKIAPMPEGGSYTNRTLFVELGDLIYVMWLDDNQYNQVLNKTVTFATKSPAQNPEQFRAELLAAYESMYNSPIVIEPMPADVGMTEPQVAR